MDEWNEDPAAALAEAERGLAEEGKGWWWGPAPRFQALAEIPFNFERLESRHADLSKTRIADVSRLADRPDLDSLVLNEHVTDIGALAALPSLGRLVAYTAPLRDLAPLSSCRALESLQINVEHVADLSPLADLPNLKSLELWSYRGQGLWRDGVAERLELVHNSGEPDLSPLESWRSLVSLSFSRAPAGDSLPRLPAVTFLAIAGCGDGHIAALASYSSLEQLYAYDSTVSDLRPLASCSALQSVTLSRSKISSVEALLGTATLTKIWIGETDVRDVAALSYLPKLEELWAEKTDVEALGGWNRRSTVSSLRLEDTKVADISPLAGTKIKVLSVAGTPLSDISAINDMTDLSILDISRSQVGDIGPILRHSQLMVDRTGWDFRDSLGHGIHFADTPATRADTRLHDISLLPSQDRVRALLDHYAIR